MPNCIYCTHSGLVEVDHFKLLGRVTSDCKPWKSGGRIAVCAECGFPQTVVDKVWIEEVASIYSSYELFHQSAGGGQVLLVDAGTPVTDRSDHLLERLGTTISGRKFGRLLDFGCGNGDFLRSFSRLHPNWQLNGFDISDHRLQQLEKINNFAKLYSDDPSLEGEVFDLIALTHSLEHLPEPLKTLRSLKDRLSPDGHLIIEVPNCQVDPFALLVADHCSHFSPTNLRILLEAAGFEIMVCTSDWISKEIVAVARRSKTTSVFDGGGVSTWLSSHTTWLSNVLSEARVLAANNKFAIFGTSIAGTWLYGELKGDADLFVDEDPLRFGRALFGIQVVHPSQVPDDCVVYVALAPVVAERVVAKLRSSIRLIETPGPLTAALIK